MENILIIGSSGHAKVLIDIVEKEQKFKIAGLIDRFKKVGEEVMGYTILGKDEDLPELVKNHSIFGILIGVGDNWARYQISENIKKNYPSIKFISTVHPSAQLAKEVTIGMGSVLMAGAIVNSCSSIGDFCIVNTNASLDHDSIMSDCSSLGPGVATGGNCKIGIGTAVGIGAIISHEITIGEHTVIGAGSTVLKNIDANKIAYGTPAEIICKRNSGDSYL